MKSKSKKQKVCSRGHAFEGSDPCPICYPGYYKKSAKGQKKRGVSIEELIK